MSAGNRIPFARWIARTLWAGCLLTVILLVAGCVWALLTAADDVRGAAGVQGVFLVTAALWSLNFIALVVLTAINQVTESDSHLERSPTDLSD